MSSKTWATLALIGALTLIGSDVSMVFVQLAWVRAILAVAGLSGVSFGVYSFVKAAAP